jgi:hypothetical protein
MQRCPDRQGVRVRTAPFLLVPIALCALWGSGAALAADGEAVDLGTGRVVLVPLNLGVRATAELEPGLEPVWREILNHFSELHVTTTALERQSATALWAEVMEEVRAGGPPDVHQVYGMFARRVAEQVEYGSIVFPSLVVRAARLQGWSASWDGVRRNVAGSQLHEATRVPLGSDWLASNRGVSGKIGAASLHVAVLSPDGTLRFEGAGGLALLQRLEEPPAGAQDELSVALLPDAFADAQDLREGIAEAFHRPLPAAPAP